MQSNVGLRRRRSVDPWRLDHDFRSSSGRGEAKSFACPDLSASDQVLEGGSAFRLPIWKKGLDLSLVFLMLPLALVIAIGVMLWIKSVSKGSVFFRQTRVGRSGKPFTIYKFRSMKDRSGTGLHEGHVERLIRSNRPMTKLDLLGDTRLIKGGFFLRMSGLDELPQLINVARGEMSLVGPRPCLPNEFRLYHSDHRKRFSLQPGLTGLWQVERNRDTTFHDMVAMDELYVERLSPGLDLRILVKTPGVLLRQLVISAKVRRALKRPTVRTTKPRVIDSFARPVSGARKLLD